MLYEFLISVQGKRETVNQLRDRPWISLLLQSFLLNELTSISPWNYQTNYLRQQSTNYVSLFDYFVGLVLKDLSYLLIHGDFIFYFDFPLYGWRWKNKMLLVLGLKIPYISQNPDELIALLIFFSAECQS